MIGKTIKRMRICLICESHIIHSQKWIRYFSERGHDVHVITPFPPNPVKINGSTIHLVQRRLKTKGIVKITNFFGLIQQTCSYIKKINPEIVNVLSVTDYALFGALSRFHPLVVTPWGSDVLLHPKQKKFWLYSNSLALQKCDLIVCNSKPMHKVLVDTLKVDDKKILDSNWNGIDFNDFHTFNAIGFKKKLDLENKVILFSNRKLEPLYNVDRIISMFARFKKIIPDSVLIIASDGSQKDALVDLAERLNMKQSIIFLGKITLQEMINFLNITDLYITVPKSDSCATSLLEAFACKKTVIASDIEANRDWIITGENGWLVNLDKKNEFTNICLKALNEPLSEKVFENNLEILRKKADYFVNMRKIENEYLNLIGRLKKK